MFFRKKYPEILQVDAMDCGPTCLRMIAKYYGKSYDIDYLRSICDIDREGVSLLGISNGAEKLGFRTVPVKIPYITDNEEDVTLQNIPLPCIAHWNQNHFIVVYDVSDEHVIVGDPAIGVMNLKRKEFEAGWLSDITGEDKSQGIVLAMEPSPDFDSIEEVKNEEKSSFKHLFKYLKHYKALVAQVFIGLTAGMGLQLIAPYLTQSIVDVGIQHQDIDFIYLILIAQLMLFLGQTAINFIRGWVLLHLGSRVSIALVSDFLIKLMKLPISYFETKMVGDIFQRIDDNQRIQSFLTSSSLSTLFSLVSLVVFSIILFFYNVQIFFTFLIASVLYVAWIFIFLGRRKSIDAKRFTVSAENQAAIVELVHGMQEIKLQGCEKQKRWQWEGLQGKMFKNNLRGLAVEQYQESGSNFINELKNIIISFFAAQAVIKGEITLGTMMSIQYIIGQLNSPLAQLIGFIRAAQDAKMSLERLGEVYMKDDEEGSADEMAMEVGNELHDITFQNVNFKYNALSNYVLQDINIVIPKGKVTAIVGSSGSGKTTLLKLILGFYREFEGAIRVGSTDIQNIPVRSWRNRIGAVMQDGYIFSDTIAKNISISDTSINKTKLLHAVQVANIKEFIDGLPLKYNTKIGSAGNGISQGQRQRMLIARAVYKNPTYILFDEATNALDSTNERVIMENLEEFYKGKTVIVVAHRLSTVKNADNIIVLEKGKVIEEGNHKSLVEKRGAYFNLVRNQLELGD